MTCRTYALVCACVNFILTEFIPVTKMHRVLAFDSFTRERDLGFTRTTSRLNSLFKLNLNAQKYAAPTPRFDARHPRVTGGLLLGQELSRYRFSI
jgi:hypothetical protein